jgi:hypothetical protein
MPVEIDYRRVAYSLWPGNRFDPVLVAVVNHRFQDQRHLPMRRDD